MVPFNSCISFTGQDKCFPCPAGFHCSKGLRRRCPPGFYCPQKTGVGFYPCPPGTYNPSYGLSRVERCQQCPAGEEMTEYSDCPCRAVSKRVISLHISFPNPLMCVSPLGNANIKIHSQRRFLVPLVVSPGEPQVFWGSAEEFGVSQRSTTWIGMQFCPSWADAEGLALSKSSPLPSISTCSIAALLFFLPVYWYSFPSVVFQECSVENGDYLLQAVPAGQDSSVQQVLNLAFRGQKEKWKSRKLWPFRNCFLYILCAISPWLLLQRVPG